MNKINLILWLVCSVSLGLQGQDKRTLINLDVFDMEWASSPQISPDGQRIVYLRRGFDIMSDQSVSHIWMMNADGTKHQKLFEGDNGESNPTWSNDSQKLAYTSQGTKGTEIYVYDFMSNKSTRISELERSPSALSWSPDGKWIAFSMFVPEPAPQLAVPPKKPKGAKWAAPVRVTDRLKYESDGRGYMPDGYRHYFVVPSVGGTERQLTKGAYNFSSTPQWTKESSGLIFSSNLSEEWAYDFRNSEIYHLDMSTGDITQLTDRNGPDRGPVVSPDGNSILYTGYDDQVQTYQVSKVYRMKRDGSEKEIIDLGLDRNPNNLMWSNDGHGFYFMYDEEGNTKIGYHQLKKSQTSEVVESVGGTTLGRPYGGGSYSLSNQGQIAYTSCSPYRPADISIVSKDGTSAQLTSLNADVLDFIKLGEVKEIWFNSDYDGRRIQGWYVLPPDFDSSRKYPLLVENHGGPISNYGDRFSLEIQLYAADGYVVFYPNPRGSTSYGEEFGNLLYHNYPGNDYDDVMSGVDHMISLGFIDQEALFVTGGSAGGIMTAWMIGKNNRFRSAAVIKPVINWVSKTLMADNYYGYANSRFPGQPWENIETYMKFSPISLVGNVQTPTLVMVGMEDKRTPPSEAKQFYGALKIRKIPTMLVELPGASHGIANRPSQLIAKVDNILAWFRKYR
jgi:dipeptidyl aminopeptidase/acylaminoacyl peptidase